MINTRTFRNIGNQAFALVRIPFRPNRNGALDSFIRRVFYPKTASHFLGNALNKLIDGHFGLTLVRIATLFLLAFVTSCSTSPTQTASAPNAPRTQYREQNPFHVRVTNPYTPANMVGQKLIRIALLAPINSTNPTIKEEAETLEAAARLALSENGDGKIVLFSEDSGATPEEATTAVKSALSKGADVVLGPLFASGVTAVAPYTRANNALLFSFSTDSAEAGRGVYVFSFLPEGDATRIVGYAGSHGIRRMVILAPIGRYGDRIVAAANATAAASNVTILGTERYEVTNNVMTGATDAARRAAILSRGGNRGQTAIFIPERGSVLRGLVQTLSLNGASTSRVRYLGTSQWNEPATISDSRALGSWFVRTDISNRASFETKLRNQSQRRATRLAGMGYDVVTMLSRMGRQGERSSISPTAIENPAGFDGVDGHYHFENGVIARDLAIVEIAPNGARVIDGAR